MKLYKLSNGLFRIGDNIVPAGTCILELKDGDTFLLWKELESNRTIASGYIGRILKENGTPYGTLNDILTAIKDSFIPEVANIDIPVPPTPSGVEFISGIVDNFSALPDPTVNDEKFWVTMHDITISGHNKQAGIYLSRGDVWKRVVKFTNAT